MTTKMKVMTHTKNDGLHSTNLILAERLEGLVHQHKVSDRKFQFRTQMTERRMITKPECGIMMVGKIKEEEERRKCWLKMMLKVQNEAIRMFTWKVTIITTATVMGMEASDYPGYGKRLIRHRSLLRGGMVHHRVYLCHRKIQWLLHQAVIIRKRMLNASRLSG